MSAIESSENLEEAEGLEPDSLNNVIVSSKTVEASNICNDNCVNFVDEDSCSFVKLEQGNADEVYSPPLFVNGVPNGPSNKDQFVEPCEDSNSVSLDVQRDLNSSLQKFYEEDDDDDDDDETGLSKVTSSAPKGVVNDFKEEPVDEVDDGDDIGLRCESYSNSLLGDEEEEDKDGCERGVEMEVESAAPHSDDSLPIAPDSNVGSAQPDSAEVETGCDYSLNESSDKSEKIENSAVVQEAIVENNNSYLETNDNESNEADSRDTQVVSAHSLDNCDSNNEFLNERNESSRNNFEMDDVSTGGDLPTDGKDNVEGRHGSEGDSSPGRLRIDAEETSRSLPVSDDDADPDALTIDTAGMETENSVVEDENNDTFDNDKNAERVINLSSSATTIDVVIDSVAKGFSTISESNEYAYSPVKRKGATRKLKNQSRSTRFAPAQGKILKRRQISSSLKCPRCPMSSFNTVTALLEHQRSCGNSALLTPSPSATGVCGDTPKAPRKVYMCSACGSYYENWDLFLHMKEMHKRHICLHCLGMFSQAGKLAQHLAVKHKIMEHTFLSGDELALMYPGPQFMLCCRCDRMCNDKDFESHSCSTVCSHCGLAGTHYPTCRLAPPPVIRPIKLQRRRTRGPRRPREPPRTVPSESSPPPGHPTPPVDDLSPTTFNERMMQLYRVNKVPDRTVSSLESIEESINRVVESATTGSHVETPPEEDNGGPSPAVSPASSPPLTALLPSFKTSPDDEQPPPAATDDMLSVPHSPDGQPICQGSPLGRSDDDHDHDQDDDGDGDDDENENENDDDESSDSEKLTIELEPKKRRGPMEPEEPSETSIVMAGEETPFTFVPLPEPLDVPRVPTAMKLFVRSTSLNCVYCAHARKIAVNAKQLALHLLAQHRYAIVPESASVADHVESHTIVVRCLREALTGLESIYFNAYGFDSSDKSAWRSCDRLYECFHCCYSTSDSKEFLSHNRKIHQNANHLCIMCKSRFLTYSELLCHLCGGVYVPGRIIDPHLRYRCYICDVDPLPSSFQLMVHLRQVHTACDLCFFVCDSQLALSTHVPKHKFLFYCYACGLTYRARQDVTKHIFWKHGAEGVTCKRCLQKKWRHAYHFCLPPPDFPCEECGSRFKTALTLRVHKRLHEGIFPHACTQCSDRFISKKLLAKHVSEKHEPSPFNGGSSSPPSQERIKEKKPKKKKQAAAAAAASQVRDVFDLPPVNLSETDDSSGDEKPTSQSKGVVKTEEVPPGPPPVENTEQPAVEELTEDNSIAMGSVWDGVLASLEKKCRNDSPDSPFYNLPSHKVKAIMLADHSYCIPNTATINDSRAGLDHDYCTNGKNTSSDKRSPRKSSKRRTRSSSSESTSSSSSSCSCGSNCSCSSSSSSTESASSSELRSPGSKPIEPNEKQRKVKDGEIKTENEIDMDANVDVGEAALVQVFRESDLDTEEPVTDDDDFYEANPALRASEVLRRNRSLLVDRLESSPRPSQVSPRRKLKKKRSTQNHFGVGRSPKVVLPVDSSPIFTPDDSGALDSDGRRPRRKRVPLKFYGFSSGEEDEAMAAPKKRERIVEHNTTIPAPAPEPEPSSPSPEPSNYWNLPSWRPPPVVPKVNPIKIRTGSLKQTFAKSVDSGEFTITRAEFGGFHVNGAANATRGEKLYCFCQCPYDEVSEMIACDATDCRIEWFHFECVGIMVPPKGKWYCPECKKKQAAESELRGSPLCPV